MGLQHGSYKRALLASRLSYLYNCATFIRVEIEKYIEPLYMNGLHGRMLRLPSQNPNYKREMLLIYGHHSSIERMQGFVEILSHYGNITVPDLPGFGGMEAFYKIGEKPTIENYADYIAAFVKLRYKRKKFVLIGMSFSVPIYVRMLQKYPELVKKVDLCISLVGFVHKEDFCLPKKYMIPIKILSFVGSKKIPAALFKGMILRERPVKLMYKLVADKHGKLLDAGPEDRARRIDMETKLWVVNDFRTKMFTQLEMFRVDLCNIKLDTKMCHMNPRNDIYFDKKVVDQHMQIIFSKFESCETPFEAHAPSVTATAKDIIPFIPKRIIQILKKID